MSGMMPVLENFSIGTNGERLCIYGDPTYPLRWYFSGLFRGAQIIPDQNEFNKSMSKVRISIEWLFGNVTENFTFSEYRKSQKIGLSSIGNMYLVSALLTNADTYLYNLYKNHCSNYFDVNPPFLEEYFR